jgi:hypothetical protein
MDMAVDNSEYRMNGEKSEELKSVCPANSECKKIMYTGLIHACINNNINLREHQLIV